MKALLDRVDRPRLAALLLWTLPVLALLPLGLIWLWRTETLFYWLAALVACSAAGHGLQYWLRRRDRRLLAGPATVADPHWPPKADGAWSAVETLAESVTPDEWPLNDGSRLLALGRQTLAAVARHYHPDVEQPLLQLTLPHTLLIIERASRDLRMTVTEHIPFSHRLTIGALTRARDWLTQIKQLWNLYRAGRLVINPADALMSEVWTHLRNRGYELAWPELQRWLLQEYVRKTGYYAIELYSGRLTLTDVDTTPAQPPGYEAAQTTEPLRILVLGRANAGKSSLLNALFGQLTAATDVLPDTTAALTRYRLEREGLEAALIFDTPGSDRGALTEKSLLAVMPDLIFWVCAAHRPDREPDRECLNAVRAWYTARPDQRPPPILVVMTHIDQLRPSREWEPPYDLRDGSGGKAGNIRAAVAAVAADLAAPVADVIPVCLAVGRVYNVDDALWAAILARQDEARRVRFLRCLEQRKRAENWALLFRQMVNTGRFLLDLPRRILL